MVKSDLRIYDKEAMEETLDLNFVNWRNDDIFHLNDQIKIRKVRLQ